MVQQCECVFAGACGCQIQGKKQVLQLHAKGEWASLQHVDFLRKHAGLLECAIPSLHLAEIEIVALEVVL